MTTKKIKIFPFVSPPSVTDNGEAVEESRTTTQAISYIPYGEVFVEQQASGWSSPYLFNAKELDSETGLYYYGARYLDPSDAMWLSVDPLWEKYVGMTPYQYCMGNPVKLVDVDGRKVEEDSKKEWNENRSLINKKIESLQKSIDDKERKAVEKGWSQEKLNKKTAELKSRISCLNKKNDQLNKIEESSQVYRLKKMDGNNLRGDVSLNPSDKVIEISYFSIDNFVHETTHAFQFESGDIAFNPNRNPVDGNVLFMDIWDEVNAYIMENAYSGNNTLSSINPCYVRGIMYNGNFLYDKIPNMRIGVNSTVLEYDLANNTNFRGNSLGLTILKNFFYNLYAK